MILRRIAATGLTAVLALAGLAEAAPGDARFGTTGLDGGHGDDGGITAELRTVIVDADSAAASDAAGTRSVLIWVAQPILSVHPDGDNDGLCRGWRWVAAETEEEATHLRTSGRDAYDLIWQELIRHEAPDADPDIDCPTAPGEQVPRVALRDTVRALVTGQLPRPQLSIPPGYALTGMRAYLVTGDDHALTYDADHSVAVGPFLFELHITATGSTLVDWGDGSDPVVADEPGRPYPDGRVHHTYRDRGRVTVTATDEWAITFTATEPSGATLTETIGATLTDVALVDFPVQTYRAVRVAPHR